MAYASPSFSKRKEQQKDNLVFPLRKSTSLDELRIADKKFSVVDKHRDTDGRGSKRKDMRISEEENPSDLRATFIEEHLEDTVEVKISARNLRGLTRTKHTFQVSKDLTIDHLKGLYLSSLPDRLRPYTEHFNLLHKKSAVPSFLVISDLLESPDERHNSLVSIEAVETFFDPKASPPKYFASPRKSSNPRSPTTSPRLLSSPALSPKRLTTRLTTSLSGSRVSSQQSSPQQQSSSSSSSKQFGLSTSASTASHSSELPEPSLPTGLQVEMELNPFAPTQAVFSALSESAVIEYIQNLPDPQIVSEEGNLIHSLAIHGTGLGSKVLKLLLKKKVSPHAHDSAMITPIIRCVENWNLLVLGAFRDLCPEAFSVPDGQGRLPLHAICEFSSPDVSPEEKLNLFKTVESVQSIHWSTNQVLFCSCSCSLVGGCCCCVVVLLCCCVVVLLLLLCCCVVVVLCCCCVVLLLLLLLLLLCCCVVVVLLLCYCCVIV